MTTTCEICGDIRVYHNQRTGENVAGRPPIKSIFEWKLVGHEACVADIDKRRADEHRQWQKDYDRQAKLRFLAEEFSLPVAKIEALTFDHWGTERDSTARRLQAWKPGKPGLLLSGRPGIGKTHMLRTMARHVFLEHGLHIAWCNVNRWLDSMRDSFDDKKSRLEPMLQRLERVDVLFLDDLGAEKLSEWAETKLERVLSYRLDFESTVFASTNLTEGGLSEKFNSRTLSRLAGLCEFVVMRGNDLRPVILRERMKDTENANGQ